MNVFGLKNPQVEPKDFGISGPDIYWNLSPSALIERSVEQGQAKMTSLGALAVNTGKFTGRSPKDRFIVHDSKTAEAVDWGEINQAISTEHYNTLYKKVTKYLNKRDKLYIRDAYACSHLSYRLNIRVITEHPWQNLFAYNMFLRPDRGSILDFDHDWIIYAAPGCKADPASDGTRQDNFAIINFTDKVILIGGTAYTGEIKKGIFSVLNFILPAEKGVLSMHCSANVGKKGDTSLFFGLSGTGKTTLSNDPDRQLIGDDEHGWSTASVFNFEGGCYAKTINLSESKEPEIYGAIRFGAMLENIGYKDEVNRVVDFDDDGITQNTRVSYPVGHIDNIVFNSRGEVPENIFFLTCDAFGVLPPLSRLSKEQAMYYFLLGYTAKIAGTEAGINEPQATFSACFGSPFLPLHPTVYAELLGKKIEEGSNRSDKRINVWLINTGWNAGGYGKSRRIELSYTRAMIKAALDGHLDEIEFYKEPFFNLEIPRSCPDVPNAILNPRDTWPNEEEYDHQANMLLGLFEENFKQYSTFYKRTMVVS